MHLADSINIFPDCRLWLAQFDEDTGCSDSDSDSERTLAAAGLSRQDRRRWDQYRPAARKRQFLNSRLAVQAVLQKELGEAAAHVEFDSDSQGCPILVSERIGRLPQISLSHSGDAVAVSISWNAFSVGVDIETVEPLKTEALQLVAAHAHERTWCNSQTGRESDALATLWTIKEAVWKTLHSDYAVTMSCISVESHPGTLTPCVEHPAFRQARFRTQLFVVGCDSLVSGTICPVLRQFGRIQMRGCVAQRVA